MERGALPRGRRRGGAAAAAAAAWCAGRPRPPRSQPGARCASGRRHPARTCPARLLLAGEGSGAGERPKAAAAGGALAGHRALSPGPPPSASGPWRGARATCRGPRLPAPAEGPAPRLRAAVRREARPQPAPAACPASPRRAAGARQHLGPKVALKRLPGAERSAGRSVSLGALPSF